LAAPQGLALRHLEPLLQVLATPRHPHRISRGPRGGYRLTREPSDISVEDILRGIGSMEDDSLLNEIVLPAWLLRDLCFGNDLTHFFVAEWRAEDVHADVAGDSPQLGHVTRKKAPPLDILEEALETAGGDRHREANTLGTIGPPGVRTELRVCPKTSGGITKFSEHEAD